MASNHRVVPARSKEKAKSSALTVTVTANTSQRGEHETVKQGCRHVLIIREGEGDPQVVRCDSVDHVDPASEERG